MNLVRRWLLIGNSRWHWAELKADEWQFCHSAPDPRKLNSLEVPLEAWAAVGPLPSTLLLNPADRLNIENVPLKKLPRWLGIDRALAAWGALKRAQASKSVSTGLLVADAGTVLSLTRITANGEFGGGQLVAGLRLQLLAMAQGAQNLNDPGLGTVTADPFPRTTVEAMRRGSLEALTGTLIEAQRKAELPLWLCGGDAPLLVATLKERDIKVFHHPNLALEGMVNLQKESGKT